MGVAAQVTPRPAEAEASSHHGLFTRTPPACSKMRAPPSSVELPALKMRIVCMPSCRRTPRGTWRWPCRTSPHRPRILHSARGEAPSILISLSAGEELQEHQVHERTYLLVASGEVEIGHDGTKVNGGPGFLAHFGPNERHAVRAITDARIVLVLAPWPGEGHPSRFAADHA